MEQRPFGAAGPRVPAVGQGTWKMESDDQAAAVAALRRGLDLGLTHIDTAEIYGGGVVEETCVRPAIAGRRQEVFLVSKVKPTNATYDGTIRACERSLRRLGTDWLDCYLLHWPGPHPIEQTIAAFEKLVEDGKIRRWGVSNFDVSDLAEVQRISSRNACNQVLYHLRAREVEHDVLPWCAKHGVAVVGYSPFGSGDFPAPGSKTGRVLADIGRQRGTSMHAVALAFLLRDPNTLTIPKASTIAHVEENRRAADLQLSAEEIQRIDATFPVADAPLGSL